MSGIRAKLIAAAAESFDSTPPLSKRIAKTLRQLRPGTFDREAALLLALDKGARESFLMGFRLGLDAGKIENLASLIEKKR